MRMHQAYQARPTGEACTLAVHPHCNEQKRGNNCRMFTYHGLRIKTKKRTSCSHESIPSDPHPCHESNTMVYLTAPPCFSIYILYYRSILGLQQISMLGDSFMSAQAAGELHPGDRGIFLDGWRIAWTKQPVHSVQIQDTSFCSRPFCGTNNIQLLMILQQTKGNKERQPLF